MNPLDPNPNPTAPIRGSLVHLASNPNPLKIVGTVGMAWLELLPLAKPSAHLLTGSKKVKSCRTPPILAHHV
jgi:hypothetical protein